MSIEFDNYTSCKVFIGQDLIMITDSVPELNLKTKRISFSEIHIKDCFYGKYLGEDFTIELWEADIDEPAIYFYSAGIMKFGMINLHEISGERVVTIKDMEFEYHWSHDIKERIPEDSS